MGRTRIAVIAAFGLGMAGCAHVMKKPVLIAQAPLGPNASHEQIAQTLDAHALNLHGLARYYGIDGSGIPPQDKDWAIARMHAESDAMRELIKTAESALAAGANLQDVPAPKMYKVSYHMTITAVKGEGELVGLAVTQANLGAGLAYLLRARDSRRTASSVLAIAEKEVARDRASLAVKEAELAAVNQ